MEGFPPFCLFCPASKLCVQVTLKEGAERDTRTREASVRSKDNGIVLRVVGAFVGEGALYFGKL